MADYGADLKRLVIGLSATAGGITVSIQQVEQWLRLVSLTVGIAVGIASFISLIITIRNKLKGRDDK